MVIKLLTNRFASTTKKSMKCVVNWIPLRIRVRSRNTQPTLLNTLKLLTKRSEQMMTTNRGNPRSNPWPCGSAWGRGLRRWGGGCQCRCPCWCRCRCRCQWSRSCNKLFYLSRCQSRCRSMCRSSCRFPPPHIPRFLGSPSEIWGSYDCLNLSTSPRNGYLDWLTEDNYHLSSW